MSSKSTTRRANLIHQFCPLAGRMALNKKISFVAAYRIANQVKTQLLMAAAERIKR